MRRKVIIIAILCFVLLGISTCTKDIYAPDACFTQNVLPIFVSNCTMSGCHNSNDKSGGYDLTSYEGIMRGVKPHHPLLSEIYKVVKGKNPSMPQRPYPKLSNNDVNLIKLWINAGASKTSNCVSCDTSNFTYHSRISPILKSWCVGCHNSGNKGGNIDLSDYTGVSASLGGNRLIGSIKHLPGFVPMPQSGGQMSDCQVHAIEKWINAGHPDN